MKALLLNGSARGDKGVTYKLLNALSVGMSKAGLETVFLNLIALQIAPCRACLHCMHINPGKCIQRDDMEIIYTQLQQSHVVVFGSPVYLDGISAQLKTVIDRMVCCMEPFLRTDAFGFTRHSFSWEFPEDIIAVSTCGFPEYETFTPFISYFNALSKNLNSCLVTTMCIPGSIAIQMKPELLDPKLKLIETAGYEYGKNGCIDNSLIDAIHQPLFTKDEYFEIAHTYEEWCRRRLAR